MNHDSHIVADPNVMMGKPVVRGTRITVEHVLEELAAGRDVQDLVSSHPRLTLDGVRAALAFAAGVLRSDVVHPL